jgi:HSP20 family protein
MAGEVTRMPNRDVARRNGGNGGRLRPVFVPRSDVYETGDSIVILAEMPGVAPDDVDITLERRMLTIRGHTLDAVHEGYRKVYAEYDEGEYERVFTLPEEIRGEKKNGREEKRKGFYMSERSYGAFAEFKQGILTISLPKTPEARSKAKKIEVKAA